jgi:hypothetical protein
MLTAIGGGGLRDTFATYFDFPRHKYSTFAAALVT